MTRSLVEPDRCERIKKRTYLPNVDEYRSSSQALTDVALQDILAVTSSKSKTLKHGYIADLTREGGISPCSLMLGLLYIQRLSHANPKYLKKISSRDLFLVSMVVASKYMNDEGESEALTNSDWSQIGCKPKALLDSQELDFLDALDWRLYVSMDEYYSFVTGIEGRIALSQAMVRGWLTYTDMAAIWEASDMQDTMLEASAQAGKVTFAGAAMYLVCIATLFAAGHSVHMVSETWSAAGTGVSISSNFSGSDSGVLFQDTMRPPLTDSENASCSLPSGLDAAFRGARWQPDHTEARSWLKGWQPREPCRCGHTFRKCGTGLGCGREGVTSTAHTCLMDYGHLPWICDGCRNKNCSSLGTKRGIEQNCGHATACSTETGGSKGVADLGMELNALGTGPCLKPSNRCSREQTKKLHSNGTTKSLSSSTHHSNLTYPFSFDTPIWNLSSASLQFFFAVLGLLFLGLGKPHAAVLREALVSIQ